MRETPTIITLLIGLYFALKYGKKAKKDIENYHSKK
jgi:hypothetical protein